MTAILDGVEIHSPLIITARLMAGVAIGGGYISVGPGPRNHQGRMVYGCFIDLPDGTEHEVDDFCSGCGGGELHDGVANLLGFLGAAAESYRFEQENPGYTGENTHLFPLPVVMWAADNSDEISMLECLLEELLQGQSAA